MKTILILAKHGIYSYDVPWEVVSSGTIHEENSALWSRSIEKHKKNLMAQQSYCALRIVTVDLAETASMVESDEIFTIPLKERMEINKPEEKKKQPPKTIPNPSW
jgi:hypothetical protein